MRAAIYSPYLDTFGGGEKYMMTIAEILSATRIEVDVLLDNHLLNFKNELKTILSSRFNLNLEKVNFIHAPIGAGSDFGARLFFLKKYDLLFYLTDGSIFLPTAKRNILHIQSPLEVYPSKGQWGKIKLSRWNLIIYNSNFTKIHAEKNWPVLSEVVYPPVDTDIIKKLDKKKYILSVGRFFGYLRDKKHELLIESFKKIYTNKVLKDWRLCIAGSASEGDASYLDELKLMAKGLPIEFYPNISHQDLLTLYGEASIYWHASGFGETEAARMEHFGISTVEAMSAGCVPVVINKGGQTEIVDNSLNGYLWDELDQLSVLTLKLVKDKDLMKKMSIEAIKKSKVFSKEEFKKIF